MKILQKKVGKFHIRHANSKREVIHFVLPVAFLEECQNCAFNPWSFVAHCASIPTVWSFAHIFSLAQLGVSMKNKSKAEHVSVCTKRLKDKRRDTLFPIKIIRTKYSFFVFMIFRWNPKVVQEILQLPTVRGKNEIRETIERKKEQKLPYLHRALHQAEHTNNNRKLLDRVLSELLWFSFTFFLLFYYYCCCCGPSIFFLIVAFSLPIV